MKIGEIGKSLMGACIVYVAMAACSAAGREPSGAASGTASGSHSTASSGHGGAGQGGYGGTANVGQGGDTGAGQGGDDAGIWDALTDPVSEAAAEPTSGSRLKAKYRVGDDGSKAYLPYIWYDSQRQEDCYFTVAADGKERCLPTTSVASAGVFFADAACSTPVPYWYANCSVKYVLTYGANMCLAVSGAAHIYDLGAPVNPPVLYTKSGNSCVSAGAPNPSYSYYSMGPEVSPSSFVASTVQIDP